MREERWFSDSTSVVISSEDAIDVNLASSEMANYTRALNSFSNYDRCVYIHWLKKKTNLFNMSLFTHGGLHFPQAQLVYQVVFPMRYRPVTKFSYSHCKYLVESLIFNVFCYFILIGFKILYIIISFNKS